MSRRKMRRRRLMIEVAGLAVVLALGGSVAVTHWLLRSSPVLRTITLPRGTNTGAMVIDERGDRAFLSLYSDTPNTNKVLMLDAATDRPLRTIILPNQPTLLAIDARRHRLLVAGGIGASWYLSLLETRRGRLLKTVPLGTNVGWMTIDEALGRAFITVDAPFGPGQSVLVLDTTSGRRLHAWSAPGQGGIYSVGMDGPPGQIVVAGYSDAGSPGSGLTTATLTQLDAATGRRRHTFALTSSLDINIVVDPRGRYAYVTLSPGAPVSWWTGARNRQITLAGGQVRVVDLHSNSIVRTIHLPGQPSGVVPDVATGRVFVVSSGLTRLVEAIRRRQSGTFAGASEFTMPLSRGSVLTLDARTGGVVHRATVGLDPSGGVLFDHGRRLLVLNAGPRDGLGVTTGTSSLSVLDARSGAVLKTLGLSDHPNEIVADDSTHRLFVLNPVDQRARADTWSWVPGWLRRRLPFLPRPAAGSTMLPGSITVLDASRL